MANIKFSAFTQKVAQADVDFLVGYTGADNVRITPAALGDGIYLPLAGGTMTGNVIFNDGVQLRFGDSGADCLMYSDGSDTYIQPNNGNFYIYQAVDDKDISLQCDDGSGGVTPYLTLDGSEVETGFLKTTHHYDNVQARFGDSGNLRIYHDGSDSYIKQVSTGNLYIQQDIDNADMLFQADNGSGAVSTYFYLDGSLTNGTSVLGATRFPDNSKIYMGTGGDLEIYHDGSNSYISDGGTGRLIIKTDYFEIDNAAGTEAIIEGIENGAVKLYYDSAQKLETTATGIQVTDEVSIGTSIIHTGDTDTKISFGTDEIVLTTAGTDRMLVAPTGEVGIGTNSPVANSSLDVFGITGLKGRIATFTLQNSDDPTIAIANGKATRPAISFSTSNTTGIFGGSSFVAFGTSSTERMRIESTGNVGIGTDAPATKLTVSGVQHLLELTRGGVGDSKWFASADSAKLYIAEDTTSSANIKLTLEDNGDIFIGATSWSGSARVKTFEINPDTISLRSATSDTGLQYHEEFHNANGMVGSIATNASATAFNTSSDYRLKDDLQDFTGLDMVSRIPVYDFKWKSDESRGYGVMAHELQEVLPQAVSGEKDAEEMQGVDYSKIVPLLVKSIQELKAEIEELKNK